MGSKREILVSESAVVGGSDLHLPTCLTAKLLDQSQMTPLARRR